MSWHDDDQFWEAFEVCMFRPQTFARAAEEIAAAEGLLELAPGSRVLDMATGPGRHARELARRGYRVTGVDRTARYLERSQREAAAEGLEVELVRGDMREFVRPQAFDAAISLFTSFGYFETEDENLQVLRNIKESLRPGGRLLMEMASREALARDWQRYTWLEVEPGVFWLEERQILPGWERIRNRWVLISHGRQYETFLEHFLYSAADLRRLLRAAGFPSTEVFGGFDRSLYDEKAKRLVVVAS